MRQSSIIGLSGSTWHYKYAQFRAFVGSQSSYDDLLLTFDMHSVSDNLMYG